MLSIYNKSTIIFYNGCNTFKSSLFVYEHIQELAIKKSNPSFQIKEGIACQLMGKRWRIHFLHFETPKLAL